MKKLALFASGNGTNVQQICEYFAGNGDIRPDVLIVNHKDIPVIERAEKLHLECRYFSREDFYRTDNVLALLEQRGIDWIILCGFMWLIPQNIVTKYEGRIINIHPALLPKYGGKGMYGDNVHKAVINNKEKESGITIHYVNTEYDSGSIIFQAKCRVEENDTYQTLAAKIHLLEKEYYPKTIEQTVKNNI